MSVLCNGWGFLENGHVSKLMFGPNTKTEDSEMHLNNGYQGCEGQDGTTRIPRAFSRITLSITFGIRQKGGNA